MAEPILAVRDAEQAAAQILSADIRDFIAGGSESEVTMAANRAALDAVFITPRVLTGITGSDTSATLVGCQSAVPATASRPCPTSGWSTPTGKSAWPGRPRRQASR